jgi:thiamine pyrophosphate-dependent acetolactate synthase large subunit-like protein
VLVSEAIGSAHGIRADVARFPARDFAALGRAMGARAATVRSLDDLDVLERWLERPDGPLVLDCKVDPDVDAVSVMSESGAADWSMPAPGPVA